MYIWWSDPYSGMTVAAVVLTLLLLGRLAWYWSRRSAQSGVFGRILLIFWLLVIIPWAYISAKVLPSFGTARRDPAPSVEFATSTSGPMVQLSDFEGKVVLLDFWATWCAPCRASSPALASLASRFSTGKVAVIDISADEDEATWSRYVKVHPSARIEVRDTGDIAQRFRVEGRPTLVLIDQQGRIRWEQTGWSPFSYVVLRLRINKLLSASAM